MSEKKLIVDGATIKYEGLFDKEELFTIIKEFLSDKSYDRIEKMHEELVSKTGKQFMVQLMPEKKLSDYAKSVIKITINIRNLKNVQVTKDKVKLKKQQGKVNITFDGYLETDYEGRWQQKPFYVFLRTIMDKYIFSNYTNKFESEIKDDVLFLKKMIKSNLNLSRM